VCQLVLKFVSKMGKHESCVIKFEIVMPIKFGIHVIYIFRLNDGLGWIMELFLVVSYLIINYTCVTTLALGSRPRQGFARVRAKKGAQVMRS
jgi:hypothetical protein